MADRGIAIVVCPYTARGIKSDTLSMAKGQGLCHKGTDVIIIFRIAFMETIIPLISGSVHQTLYVVLSWWYYFSFQDHMLGEV